MVPFERALVISYRPSIVTFPLSLRVSEISPLSCSSKSPLKISEKRELGRIQGLPKIFGYPLLSQEREKLQISNLASTFRESIRIKAHKKFWEKGSVGVSRDCPKFSGTPYYLRNGKSYRFQIWPVHSEGPSEFKPIKNFREKGAWAYPGTAQIFGYPLLSWEWVKH